MSRGSFFYETQCIYLLSYRVVWCCLGWCGGSTSTWLRQSAAVLHVQYHRPAGCSCCSRPSTSTRSHATWTSAPARRRRLRTSRYCSSWETHLRASPAIWDHTVLPAMHRTRVNGTRLAISPAARQAGTRFTYPIGMEG